MAVKPVGVPEKDSAAKGAVSFFIDDVNMPTGVGLCQIVIVDLFMTTQAPGASPRAKPPTNWTELVTVTSGGVRCLQSFYRVFEGTPVPTTVPIEFLSLESSNFQYSSVATAWDEVNPKNPIDVVSGLRIGGSPTVLTMPSVIATAGGVGGRLLTAVRQTTGVGGVHTSEAGQEAVYNPAPAFESMWQDIANIAAPGATGTRTITSTLAAETHGYDVVLTPGPAATVPSASAPVPIDTGFFYNQKAVT